MYPLVVVPSLAMLPAVISVYVYKITVVTIIIAAKTMMTIIS